MGKRKNAAGMGAIRQKTVVKNGKTYNYWEARLSVGFDPKTGKQKQRSFTGKTQKEVLEKMQKAQVEFRQGTYLEPSRFTVEQWLQTWATDYLNAVKPRTAESYISAIKCHFIPTLGKVKLQALKPPMIQSVYNSFVKDGLSPKTIRNLHGALHAALEQAMELGYIQSNPTKACKLPRVERAEISPLCDDNMAAFINAIRGHKYENLYLVTMFTGLRKGEVLGLTWDCVDFERGTITVKQQLQMDRDGSETYRLVPTKSGKVRFLTVAPTVIDLLKAEKEQQEQRRLQVEEAWQNDMNLVFTNEIGEHLSGQTVYLNFKRIVTEIGCPNVRFHDLRHTFAVNSLRAGDDIKTVQENLGHYTAAFTLDTYAHATAQMKKESAARMENFIQARCSLDSLKPTA